MAGITKYTAERGDLICQYVAEGESMRTIAKRKGTPAISTIFKWLRENEEFSKQYARAKEDAADALVEDILDIADNGTNDYIKKLNKDGAVVGYLVNGEAIQRSRVRIDTRKWLAMKLKPKKYGDRLAVESNGKTEHTVTHKLEEKTDEELRAIAAQYVIEVDSGK